ncbi:hypothetical protein [Denitrobaculum tricleocarpae]|uniref:hypothetical protein n=1 Tax=Denitrobaculum tricleocarpae TaxID=2591009 RepID=UPI0015D3FF52|nr:hypothetical protein [Denitrobaculum tricleocarpae]
MELIAENDALLEHLQGNNSLLDSVIEKIEITGDLDQVTVSVWLKMRPSASKDKIKIRFERCKSYDFTFSDSYVFYNVERIKLFRTNENLFYVSFDPFDEIETVSDKDTDVIQASSVKAYSL